MITEFLDRLTRFVDDAWLADVPVPRVAADDARHDDRAPGVGRIIAHEIGHIVLRSKRHATSGLMSGLYRSDDLVAPARGPYQLCN